MIWVFAFFIIKLQVAFLPNIFHDCSRFQSLRENEVSRKNGLISKSLFEAQKERISVSFKNDAKKAEDENLIGLRNTRLRKAFLKNFRIPLERKFSYKKTNESLPHLFHKAKLSKRNIPIIGSLSLGVKKFLEMRIGDNLLGMVRILSIDEIVVEEYCQKSEIIGENGSKAFIAHCQISIPSFPPGHFEFSVYLRSDCVPFNEFEIPNLKKNPYQFKVRSLQEAMNTLSIRNLSCPEIVDQVFFEYDGERDCFVWAFYQQSPEISYEEVVRIIHVRCNDLEVFKVIDFPITRYR